ncbi:MAG: pyruvate carboxylase subunit B [Kiritimatiellia bacterium]|jgi:oxaloacetate decarboxylase alpha subunit|nr:pyruvate carboxylase subunit B [Kiritimatiellia bacterium]MDD4175176.1 pyruvate carboxylase subunit B [Kiritimatiellia bacterium]MDD4440871.1 pyruvate carboxylase subunit B [Kiritimatiellia bacterium]MDX9791886.1 pyruvate carboxylase subunit B [Kiritimatiellia bacterium]
MKKAEQKKTVPAATAAPRIRITDTTLRDAHQSLWATRMRTDDILAIAEEVDNAGYYSLECWGGATFDVCLRFLRENPWERLRQLKAVCKKTPLQMLLRGQNILGYKNYPDDVLERFVALACENGMDIFRIFDALNDTRNLERAIQAVKKYGGHAQGTICYTFSPVHTVDNFVAIAKEQVSMGIDTLCIKDMAGILTPGAATELVGALVNAVKVPVQLHSHMTSGMAVAMYLSAVKAGAGAIDTAVSTMSGFSSQPPTETLVAILESEGFTTGLNHAEVAKINAHFRALKKMRQPSSAGAVEPVDADVLEHHIPGGMISNLRSQLQQQGALERLPEVLEELPRTRADMGYPPLVTPTSQIVGVQAVLNVLAGKRYEMVTQETRDYVKGLYGRSPAPITPKLAKQILNGEKPVTCRPADLLKPGLAEAAAQIAPKLIEKEEDILSYCLFPEVALGYFKWRAKPADQRDPIPADIEEGSAKHVETKSNLDTPAPVAQADTDTQRFAEIGRFVASLAGLVQGSGTISLPASAPLLPQPAAPAAAPVAPPVKTVDATPQGPTINAPLNGTFYRSAGPDKPALANEGDSLKTGAPLCIVEAMKLFNQIKADKPLKVVKFLVEHGAVVSKGQPLALVSY